MFFRGECIYESLKFQDFLGEHAPKPPLYQNALSP